MMRSICINGIGRIKGRKKRSNSDASTARRLVQDSKSQVTAGPVVIRIADDVSRIPLAFKNTRVGLLVGIGGGFPRPARKDVRLGDVVVGAPESGPAVVQYDLGKQTTHDVEVMRTLNKPPGRLLRVVDKVDNEYQRAEEGEDDFFATHLQRFAKFPRLRELYKRLSTSDRLFQASYEHEDGTQCI